MDNNLKTRLQAYFNDFVDDTGPIQSISLYDLIEMQKELINENYPAENNANIKELEIIINLMKAANFDDHEYINFM